MIGYQKMEPKYFSEFAFHNFNTGVCSFPTYQFYDLTPEMLGKYYTDSHIYAIYKCPKVYICDNPQISPETVVINVKFMNWQNEWKIETHSIPNNSKSKIKKIVLSEERDLMQIIFENGNSYPYKNNMPVYHLLRMTKLASNSKIGKILYIGQAFAKGERTAFKRLQSHSTLQKILAKETQDKFHEIGILLFLYTNPPTLLHMMNGGTSPEISGKEDIAHMNTVLTKKYDIRENISIIEASLIKYFSPIYNTQFKGQYPSVSNSHLTTAYSLDFNAIITEVDTEDIQLNIYSDTVTPNYHHIAQFDLFSQEKRKSFFDIE